MVVEIKNQILKGNSLEILREFPSDSIDMSITSPPYWSLRDYSEKTEQIWGGDSDCDHDFVVEKNKFDANVSDRKSSYDRKTLAEGVEQGFCKKCGAWKGQLGLEPTPHLYVAHMVEIFHELMRVLKPTGSFYLNIGDTYCGGHAGGSIHMGLTKTYDKSVIPQQSNGRPAGKYKDYREKCLYMIPERVAFAMIEDGWILRNKIIWSKPNPMPSSVKDRLTNTWEYLFHFVKQPRYFYDLDEIRVKPKTGINRVDNVKNFKYTQQEGINAIYGENRETMANNPKGKNPGDVIEYDFKPDDRDGDRRFRVRTGSDLADAYKGPIKGNPMGKNPGDVTEVPYSIKPREKDIIQYRNLPDIDDFSTWLNKWRKEQDITITEIEKLMSNPSAHHWFNGESFPSVDDWEQFKEMFNPPDKYDENLLNVFYKSSEKINNPSGKNPGDVFTICTQPFSKAHFAVFPIELCRNPISSSCPKKVCSECGVPYIKNKKKCKCKTKDTKPGVVLDIFAGSGSALLMARKLGRRWMGIELNDDYIKIAKKRIGSKGIDVNLEEFW